MIKSLTLSNFKSFGDQEGNSIRFGPMTLIVGTNASGKSNIRDALRFLHGIARGYTLAEIIGAKYGEGGELQWKGIRGGVREAVRLGAKESSFTLSVTTVTEQISKRLFQGKPLEFRRVWNLSYAVTVEIPEKAGRARISNESLKSFGSTYFSTNPEVLRVEQPADPKLILARVLNPKAKKYIGPTVQLQRDQPLVCQLADHGESTQTTRTACRMFLKSLESIRFLDLDPQSLRRPSIPGQNVFGDKGENLSSVLQWICEDKQRRNALVEWTRELTPLDVTEFSFPTVSLEGKIQTVLVEEGGRQVSAESASDGTLRFLAYAAALLGPDPASGYFFEEIENGIHPNRIHLLLELLQRATAKKETQVIATTHSPALLNFLRGNALKDAVLVTRRNGLSRAISFQDLPLSDDDKTVAGELLESGWFENIAAFLNGSKEEPS